LNRSQNNNLLAVLLLLLLPLKRRQTLNALKAMKLRHLPFPLHFQPLQ
jgi:hypothetical protein